MPTSSATDQEMARHSLRKRFVGVTFDNITVIDIAQSAYNDVVVLCVNPTNPVHKFVTWEMDTTNFPSHRWSGHYIETLDEAYADFHNRLGHRVSTDDHGIRVWW